ncbi:MAG: hypothetical protein U5K37_01240 [Natrialbaceae archaeon]|nr:hypothetical protein [Natrialbaceae archaeon]
MATNETPAFDDLGEAPEVDEPNDGGWIDIEPGEAVVGQITAFWPDRGDRAGVVEIDGRPMSLNWTMRKQLIGALVVGATMGVSKSEGTESFEDDETGETVEYNPRQVRFEPPEGAN